MDASNLERNLYLTVQFLEMECFFNVFNTILAFGLAALVYQAGSVVGMYGG